MKMKNVMIALYQSRHRQLGIYNAQTELIQKIKDWVDESSDFDIRQQFDLLKTILTDALKAHANLDSYLENSSFPQLKTNKMRLILERTLDGLSLEDLDCIFNGYFPKSISPNIQEWTPILFQSVEDNQFFGTVKVDTLSTLLFCIAYCLNKQKENSSLKKCFEAMKESALCHSIPIHSEIQLAQGELPFSPFIQIEEEGRQNLLVVNGGYAFGGMRNEKEDWCEDPLFGPEDCTSYVAKSHGSKILYSTADQYALFLYQCGDFPSVVQNWKSGPEFVQMSVNLQVIPNDKVEPGDICMKRTGISKDKILGTSGHSGIVLEEPQIDGVTMLNASRNIEAWNTDGVGIGKMSLQTNKGTQFAFFRPVETEETLSRAGVGTPFFQQKQSNFKEESQNYKVLCPELDGKYFSNFK